MKRGVLILLTLVLLLAGCRSAPVVSVTTPSEEDLLKDGMGRFNVVHITVEDLQSRLQAGEAIVVVDARPAVNYEAEHISGAIDMTEADIQANPGALPKDKLIVFYCA